MKISAEFVARLFVAVAAAFFVAAFALAALLPPMATLGEFVASVDQGKLVRMQEFVRAHLGDWAWLRVTLPLLVRPAWLLPAALGLVAAGAALTANSRRGPQRSRRRRS